MNINPHGLHHVTAIARDPQQNVDFYASVLGLRLVKQTVNFDAPHVWHLYYGDEQGSPASLMTFFPWPGVMLGKVGAGITSKTSFSIPEGALGFWQERLNSFNVEQSLDSKNSTLQLRDPDGMLIELVESPRDTRSGWDGFGRIPQESAILGLHTVTFSERELEPTARMLTEFLGMQADSDKTFAMGDGEAGAFVKVEPGAKERALQAGGTVHHVAFRAPDIETMTRWQHELQEQGVAVTEIMDRQYFKSIYFREPGGVLFEIATDDPGFATDEPLLELGRSLKLPPWLEPSREQIAASLPKLEVPVAS